MVGVNVSSLGMFFQLDADRFEAGNFGDIGFVPLGQLADNAGPLSFVHHEDLLCLGAYQVGYRGLRHILRHF